MGLEQLTDEQNARVVAAMNTLLSSGYSQGRLAKACGVSQPYLSFILSGQRRASYPFVERLAAVMGQTVEVLLGRAEPLHEPSPAKPRFTPLEAARAMGEAQGLDLLFVRAWTPGGDPQAVYDAEELWTMLKGDYVRTLDRRPQTRTRSSRRSKL